MNWAIHRVDSGEENNHAGKETRNDAMGKAAEDGIVSVDVDAP